MNPKVGSQNPKIFLVEITDKNLILALHDDLLRHAAIGLAFLWLALSSVLASVPLRLPSPN